MSDRDWDAFRPQDEHERELTVVDPWAERKIAIRFAEEDAAKKRTDWSFMRFHILLALLVLTALGTWILVREEHELRKVMHEKVSNR